MSVTRVLVMEVPSSIPWTGFMKIFRTTTEPKLKKLRKDKTLKRWSFLQVGDHTGLLIAEFENKSKMNKYLKTLTPVRQDVTADTGLQAWAYTGAVKASG